MIWRGLDGVPRAVPVPEAIHPDPGKLSADRIGIFPATSRPSGDQSLDAWMALNIHVLPQAGVFIGVYVVTEAPVEVHRHASRVVAATGRAGGADLALKLLPIVEAEHQSVFAQKWNRRCGRRAASPGRLRPGRRVARRRRMGRAAAAWGVDWCRLSVGGATHANQAAVPALGRPGQDVVITRTLHRSLLLGIVLAGLRPVWVRPGLDAATGLPGAVPVAAVEAALAAHPSACGVVLGDPSYVGTRSDIAAHAAAAHAAGVPLVVDAAWAAHFGFSPAVPPHALALGADALITSAHQMLPAWSQAALLLARTRRSGGLLDPAGWSAASTPPTPPAGGGKPPGTPRTPSRRICSPRASPWKWPIVTSWCPW